MRGSEIVAPASDASIAGEASNSNGHAQTRITYVADLELGHQGEGNGDGNAPWIARGFTGSVMRIIHVVGTAPQRELWSRTAYPRDQAYEAAQ